MVYAKQPCVGPDAVMAYLSRYNHRIAIANSRIVRADTNTVTFRWNDYRNKRGDRMKVMRLDTREFIRRFLTHVLPDGLRCIRYHGFLASARHTAKIGKIRA